MAFAKGIEQGVIGIAVKPVAGMFEFATKNNNRRNQKHNNSV